MEQQKRNVVRSHFCNAKGELDKLKAVSGRW